MGLFGGTKSSSAQATGAASGGFGEFAPKNNISLSKPILDFDLSNPFELVSIGVICLAGWYAWKRFK